MQKTMQKTMLLMLMMLMLMMLMMMGEKKEEKKEEKDMLREKSNNPNLKGGEKGQIPDVVMHARTLEGS